MDDRGQLGLGRRVSMLACLAVPVLAGQGCSAEVGGRSGMDESAARPPARAAPEGPRCAPVPGDVAALIEPPVGHPSCGFVVTRDAGTPAHWRLRSLEEDAEGTPLAVPHECDALPCAFGGAVVVPPDTVDSQSRALVLVATPRPEAETAAMLWLLEPGRAPVPLWRERPVTGDGTLQGPAFELWPHRCEAAGDPSRGGGALALVVRARFDDGSDGQPAPATLAGVRWLDDAPDDDGDDTGARTPPAASGCVALELTMP